MRPYPFHFRKAQNADLKADKEEIVGDGRSKASMGLVLTNYPVKMLRKWSHRWITRKKTVHLSFFLKSKHHLKFWWLGDCACGFLDERSIDETLVFIMGPWQDGKAAKAEGKENRSDTVKEANPSEILRMQDESLFLLADMGADRWCFYFLLHALRCVFFSGPIFESVKVLQSQKKCSELVWTGEPKSHESNIIKPSHRGVDCFIPKGVSESRLRTPLIKQMAEEIRNLRSKARLSRNLIGRWRITCLAERERVLETWHLRHISSVVIYFHLCSP